MKKKLIVFSYKYQQKTQRISFKHNDFIFRMTMFPYDVFAVTIDSMKNILIQYCITSVEVMHYSFFFGNFPIRIYAYISEFFFVRLSMILLSPTKTKLLTIRSIVNQSILNNIVIIQFTSQNNFSLCDYAIFFCVYFIHRFMFVSMCNLYT